MRKLIPISPDNTNANFGKRERQGTTNVYSIRQSVIQNDNMFGVVYILNNYLHHTIGSLSICVENILMQMHNHFATFTMRTKPLKNMSELLIKMTC